MFARGTDGVFDSPGKMNNPTLQQPVNHIHFLGVCGTAMGAAAAALKARGFRVTGSDEGVYPPMSDYLARAGIEIAEGFRPENLAGPPDLVVVGNAIRRGNPEVEEVLNRKLPYLSLPETLRLYFLRGSHNLVVTGTHGKTTTTSLLAHIFESAGRSPSWLIGGIPNNLPSSARLEPSKFFIIEGDEYDTAFFDKRSKFVHYLPELLVINNIEFDHADIFRDLDDVKLAFRRVVNIVPSNGMILLNADDREAVDVCRRAPAPVLEVGFSENAAARIRGLRHDESGARFTLYGQEFFLPMHGEFNVRNAAMAVSAARFYGIPFSQIRAALASFQGVRRRQEIRGVAGGVAVVDDFAHHPTAIRLALEGLRRKHPQGRIWAVFEPRSNTTRRAVFQHVLPEAFAGADGVWIAPVARPEQLAAADRLDTGAVARAISELPPRPGCGPRPAFAASGVDDIVEGVRARAKAGDLVAVFSNGGFGGIHEKLLAALAPAGEE